MKCGYKIKDQTSGVGRMYNNWFSWIRKDTKENSADENDINKKKKDYTRDQQLQI